MWSIIFRVQRPIEQLFRVFSHIPLLLSWMIELLPIHFLLWTNLFKLKLNVNIFWIHFEYLTQADGQNKHCESIMIKVLVVSLHAYAQGTQLS